MSRVLLYYPSIEVPNNEWMRGAILYTDKIASISPFKDMNNPRTTDTMRYLHDHGLYEQISVFDGLQTDHHEYKEFEKSFIDAISTKEFDVYKRKKRKRDLLSYDYRNYELYIQKISYNILDVLKDKKLFTEDISKRMLFDRKTAFLYMSMLSEYMSKVERRVKKNHVTPATDDPEAEGAMFKMGADTKNVNAYEIVFNDCLPKPKRGVSIDEIISFKKEREYELSIFRKEIEAIEKAIRDTQGNEYVLSQIREGLRERLGSSVKMLRKEMRKAKLEGHLSSFSALATYKGDLPTAVMGTGGLSFLGAAAASSEEPWMKLGVGTVLLILTSVVAYYKRTTDLSNNTLSYVYFAKKKGIIE
jgi:hypothetical protein